MYLYYIVLNVALYYQPNFTFIVVYIDELLTYILKLNKVKPCILWQHLYVAFNQGCGVMWLKDELDFNHSIFVRYYSLLIYINICVNIFKGTLFVNFIIILRELEELVILTIQNKICTLKWCSFSVYRPMSDKMKIDINVLFSGSGWEKYWCIIKLKQTFMTMTVWIFIVL